MNITERCCAHGDSSLHSCSRHLEFHNAARRYSVRINSGPLPTSLNSTILEPHHRSIQNGCHPKNRTQQRSTDASNFSTDYRRQIPISLELEPLNSRGPSTYIRQDKTLKEEASSLRTRTQSVLKTTPAKRQQGCITRCAAESSRLKSAILDILLCWLRMADDVSPVRTTPQAL